MASSKISEVQFKSAGEFVFEVPLYTGVRLTFGEARRLFSDPFPFDAEPAYDGYCADCKQSSIFAAVTEFKDDAPLESLVGIRELRFTCARNTYHRIWLWVRFKRTKKSENLAESEYEITKLGQYPSHADIGLGVIKHYANVVDETDRAEIVRAIGLAANGVSIGAFVYLRRTIERLIERHYQEPTPLMEEEKWRKLRVKEKVKQLGSRLPHFLVENSEIYGILSTGIHDLTEDECGKYFQILLQSILFILEKDKEERQKVKRELEIRKSLQGMSLLKISRKADEE